MVKESKEEDPGVFGNSKKCMSDLSSQGLDMKEEGLWKEVRKTA